MITNEELIKVWQKSESIDDVVSATNMRKQTIQARINRLKKAGVPLKKAGRTRASQAGKARVDVAALKALAESLK